VYLQAGKCDAIQAGQVILGSILKYEGVCPHTCLSFIADRPPAPADKAIASTGNRDRVSPVAEAPKIAEFHRLRHNQGSATAAPVTPVVDVPTGINAVEGSAVPIPILDVASRAADIRIQVCANDMVAAAAAGLWPDSDIDSGDGSNESWKQVKGFHLDGAGARDTFR
jgi:hypothetical protein